MTEHYKKVSEWVAKAGDTFMAAHPNSGLLMGVIDKQLRSQGIPANAVSIEIPAKNIKILVVVFDFINADIEFHIGNKSGDVYSTYQESYTNLSEERISEILNIELSIDRNHGL